MPAQPAWFHRLDEILGALRSMTSTHLDRAAVEKLFRVRRRRIGRDDAKRRFRDGEADTLLCTEAAAEGLNFQFCGALINYDMPWNPMRVEQRIGRIDHLGQRHEIIRIVNLHYEGTVETDVYRALRNRIGLFESVVGRLQPILAQVPRAISDAVLSVSGRESAGDRGAGDSI